VGGIGFKTAAAGARQGNFDGQNNPPAWTRTLRGRALSCHRKKKLAVGGRVRGGFFMPDSESGGPPTQGAAPETLGSGKVRAGRAGRRPPVCGVKRVINAGHLPPPNTRGPNQTGLGKGRGVAVEGEEGRTIWASPRVWDQRRETRGLGVGGRVVFCFPLAHTGPLFRLPGSTTGPMNWR